MNNISPVTTRYKGYRFRSRTEARWAIVFDTINLKWIYENEGYNIPDMGWYLPDFFMPKQPALIVDSLTIEIKGIDPTQNERLKASKLSTILSAPVIILFGVPGDQGWFLYYNNLAFTSTQGYNREQWWSFAGIRTSSRLMNEAYNIARSARFEHGEGQ